MYSSKLHLTHPTYLIVGGDQLGYSSHQSYFGWGPVRLLIPLIYHNTFSTEVIGSVHLQQILAKPKKHTRQLACQTKPFISEILKLICATNSKIKFLVFIENHFSERAYLNQAIAVSFSTRNQNLELVENCSLKRRGRIMTCLALSSLDETSILFFIVLSSLFLACGKLKRDN